MTARQEARLNMYRATLNYCQDNIALITTIPAFHQSLNSFSEKVAAIISTIQQEDLATKGVTTTKFLAKQALCNAAIQIAALIYAYAAKEKNNELMQQVNFSYTVLIRSKDDILAPRCKNIFNAGITHLIALQPYGITIEVLNNFETILNSYQQKVPAPRNAAALKKTIVKKLRILFKEADAILKDQMDKTVTGFKASHPHFQSTYKNNRVIIDPSRNITNLKGTVADAANKTPITGATVIIKETGLSVTTNTAGAYIIKPLPAGTYTVKVTASGHTDIEITGLLIKQGRSNKQDFTMQSI